MSELWRFKDSHFAEISNAYQSSQNSTNINDDANIIMQNYARLCKIMQNYAKLFEWNVKAKDTGYKTVGRRT